MLCSRINNDKEDALMFSWEDPFQLRGQLSEDERLIGDTARNYANEKLAPRIIDAAREERFDRDIMREMGDLGFFGITTPEKYGGSNAGHVAQGLLDYEVEHIDSAYRSTLSVQSGLVIFPILAFGSEEQREGFLPKLVSGEHVGAFGLTEPNAGSDPNAMEMRADKVEGGYRLSGVKTWISNAPVADVLIVWAKSASHGDDIRGFVLTRDMKGIATPPIKNKLGLRASPTGQIIMEDVFVPDENLLPDAVGIKAPLSCLTQARYGLSWGVLGAAAFCWHAARDYTLERKQFGRPLAQTQLVQRKLADMQTEIALGLQACLRVGRLFENDQASPQVISLIKRNNCGKSLDIARASRDIHGGNGIADEFHVMRHMVNLEVVNTYEGTHDVHALILGRAQTGLQAFF